MNCTHNKSLDWFLKTDEPSYLVNLAVKRNKRSRDVIEEKAREIFYIIEEGVSFEEIYGKTFEEMVQNLVDKEERIFGNLESAFVPIFDYNFVSETRLKEILEKHPYYEEENRKYHMVTNSDKPFKETKYFFAELENSTSDALREIYSKCGLNFEDRIRKIPKEELMCVVNEFVENVRENQNVLGVYLIGSLANGVEFSKDADVVVVRNECKENCKIKEAQEKGLQTSRGKETVDMFCFNPQDFEKLTNDGYRITGNIKPILPKRNL